MGAQAVRLSNVDIDNALKNKEFEVQFQPIFDLGNGALARMETFVRWRHPSLGMLPPGAFISFFESQGRMSELTRYVMGEALSNYNNWRGAFPPGFSINLALSDLNDEAFGSRLSVLLREYDFPPDLITLECPMPPVNMPADAAADSIKRLAATGARLAIEVRGRANDFLRELDPFPFDEIKTGGAAILRFARTVRGPGLSAISELLEIANDANAAITAVGVEDQASLAALRGLGFTAAQGNHLARVGSLDNFRTSRVNEVRELLELPALSNEEVAALFRTGAPAPSGVPEDTLKTAGPVGKEKPNAAKSTKTAKRAKQKAPAEESEEALLSRLNERLARQEDAEVPTTEKEPAEAEKSTQKVKPKTRRDALLAKQKAAAKRKAAAIAKARRKVDAAETELEAPNVDLEEENQSRVKKAVLSAVAARQQSDETAARNLQERLSKAFPTGSDVAPDDAEQSPDDDEIEVSFDAGLSGDDDTIADDAIAYSESLEESAHDETAQTIVADAEIEAPSDLAPADAEFALEETAKAEPTEPVEEVSEPRAMTDDEPDETVADNATPDEPKSAPEDIPDVNTETEQQTFSHSMSISQTKAFFTPSIHVGGAHQVEEASPAKEERPVGPADLSQALPSSSSVAPPEFADFGPDESNDSAEEPQPSSVENDLAFGKKEQQPRDEIEDEAQLFGPDAAAVETEPSDLAGNTTADDPDQHFLDDANGDITGEEAVWAARARAIAARPGKRRQRNILTRRYAWTTQIWPTHFWPRSWKRAWRLRQQEALDRLNDAAE